MEKVIEILKNKTKEALESPTGTGKTLCLLCSSLAFLKNQREIDLLNQNKILNKFKNDFKNNN